MVMLGASVCIWFAERVVGWGIGNIGSGVISLPSRASVRRESDELWKGSHVRAAPHMCCLAFRVVVRCCHHQMRRWIPSSRGHCSLVLPRYSSGSCWWFPCCRYLFTQSCPKAVARLQPIYPVLMGDGFACSSVPLV